MSDSTLFAVVALGLGIWLVMGLVSLYNRCKKALRRNALKRREARHG
jgi:hypothetical protein